MKTYKCKLEILTAVHIGTGEDLSPMDYFIISGNRGDDGNGKLFRFSMDKVIGSLNKEDRAHLMKLIEIDDYLAIHKFFKEGNRAEKYGGVSYRATISSEIEKEYLEYMRLGKTGNVFLRNQMLISETKHIPGTMVPYIPGSSIKGAIRTAVLDYLVSTVQRKNIVNSRYSNEMEAQILNTQRNGKFDIDKDPFRALQISDCIMPDSSSIYVGKMNTKMSMRSEVIAGRFMGNENIYEFSIVLKDKINNNYENENIITLDNIIDGINGFSSEILNYEKLKFYNNRTNKYINKLFKEYINNINPNNNECLIRIGRYSQQQGVTLSAFHENQSGRTRTLLSTDSGSVPMGWCKLTFRET